MTEVWKRFVQVAAVLVLVATGTFFLLALMPGSPAAAILGQQNATQDAIEKVEKDLGLDQPIVQRYFTWAGKAVRGDLGVSYRDGENVASAIKQRLPTSFELMVLTQIFALCVSIPAALWAASRAGKRIDKLFSSLSFGFLAAPGFVIALFLLIVFAKTLRWFPAADYAPLGESVFRNLRALTLPVLSLSVPLIGVYYRVLRNDLSATLASDHIMRARANGLREKDVLLKHAFRSSSLTLFAVVGLNTAGLLGGVVLIEQIYSIPGLGRFLIDSAVQRDFVKVQGAVLVIAVIYVVVNLFVDLTLRVLDPRVRAAAARGVS